MNIALNHARRLVLAAIFFLVVLIILWWGLWTLGAVQYRRFVDSWIENHRGLGYQVSFDSRDTVGFPFDITLHYANFVLQDPDGIRVHANDVSLSAFPWHWNDFDAKLKHGFELTLPFSDAKILTLRTQVEVHNHTQLENNGDWKFVDLQLVDAEALWGAAPFFKAGRFQVALKRPDQPPKDAHDSSLDVSINVANLSMPPDYATPFGPRIARLDVAARVMGPAPDPRTRASVAAWSNSGGIIEFDTFHMEWGPLLLLTHGALGLDDDLQPEGAFSAQIGNHMPVLKTLMGEGYIPARETGMLDTALKLFTKKTEVDGHAGIEAPIAVQLGGLFLGPVRIFEFPEIEWEPAVVQDPTQAPASVAQ